MSTGGRQVIKIGGEMVNVVFLYTYIFILKQPVRLYYYYSSQYLFLTNFVPSLDSRVHMRSIAYLDHCRRVCLVPSPRVKSAMCLPVSECPTDRVYAHTIKRLVSSTPLAPQLFSTKMKKNCPEMFSAQNMDQCFFIPLYSISALVYFLQKKW